MMKATSVGCKSLESVLGRLETVATIMHPLAHFLNNVRSLQIKAAKKNHTVRVTNAARKDLALATEFLQKAAEGVNMNLLVFRSPSLIFIGDASEHGLGGFDSSGRAWRYLIPEHLRGRAHINLLEFLTQVVGMWIAILEGRLQKLDCFLGMGDSTTALGWMRRATFKEGSEDVGDWHAKQRVARKLARLSLDNENILYRQWFKGSDNVVADSLSRDLHYLSPSSHEYFLSHTAPHQLPNNFRILPVQEEICCFISSVLQQMPVNTQRWRQPKGSDLAHGNIGVLSSIALALGRQSSLKDATHSNKTFSSPRLPKQYEKAPTLHELMTIWWRAQSVPPYHMWHRPSGQTTGQIPDWTQMDGLASYCQSSGEPTGTRTDQEENRKHYQ